MAALVACQQCRIAGIAVPSPSIAGGLGQVFDAGKPEIEAMRRHRMHADGGITGERKAWPDEAPRPGRDQRIAVDGAGQRHAAQPTFVMRRHFARSLGSESLIPIPCFPASRKATVTMTWAA